MHDFLKKKKWMAWVVLLTFLFTSFMPSNVLAGNSVAEAAEQRGNTITPLNIIEEPDQVVIPFTKRWDDDNDSASKRPDLITVTLYQYLEESFNQQSAVLVETITITADIDWKYNFDISNVPLVNDDGRPYKFAVVEEPVENYVEVGHLDPDVKFVPPSTDNSWEKVTPCSDLTIQSSGNFKSVVIVKPTAGESCIIWTVDALSESERIAILNSAKSISGLKTDDATFISGTTGRYDGMAFTPENISFDAPSKWAMFYTSTYQKSSINSNQCVITNKYVTTINVTVMKDWKDGEAPDRPNGVSVALYDGETGVDTNKDGETDTAALNGENGWTATFINLPKNDAEGNLITYNIKEVGEENGSIVIEEKNYKVTYEEVAGVYKVVNLLAGTTSISGTKIWLDDGREHNNASEITLSLTRNSTKEGSTVETVNVTPQWNDNTYTYSELDKYDGEGYLYTYTVTESQVEGYQAPAYSGDGNYDITNIIHNHAARTSVHVEKVWNDFGNNVGAHPDITIELYQGELLYDTRTLSEGTLTADFANLPKYDANQEAYVYTVKEVPVSGYTSTVEAADGGFVITNTLQTAEVGKVTVGKTATGDNRPGDATTYKFELQIQVVQPEDSSVLGAMDQLTLKEADDTFKEADDAVEASMMMTTSASQYEYGLTEKVNLPDTQATAFMDIEYDSSSPSALQVFLNGSDTPSTLTFVENGETGDYYKVDFWLTSGANAVFDMQATSGSAIYYRIAESFDAETSANYSATSIFDATTGETMSGTAIDFTLFDADAAMAYTFTNVYTDNPSGGGPSGGGGGSYDGPYSDDPTPSTPSTEIPDQDVPLAKPDMDRPIAINDPDVSLTDVPDESVELEDSPVPLGDAPETGDQAPIGLLIGMLFMAAGGFVTVRRKGNE